MSLFKNEAPVLGQGTTLVEVGAGSTSSTTQLSNAYKPCTRELVDVTMQSVSQHVTQWIYQAPFKCQVVAVRENHTVASASGTLDVVKIVADAVAPAAANGGTIKTLLTAPMSTAGAANTRQNLALAASGSPWVLNQGDQLAVVTGGTVTQYAGSVQIEVIQLS
jgi:hypothetical protein